MLFKKLLLTCSTAAVLLIPISAEARSNCTTASYYGTPSDGYGYSSGKLITANGERFRPTDYTAAHPWLPFGTRLRVTNQRNGKSIVVRINDRGPFYGGRGLDLSTASFGSIENTSRGTAQVCYSKV